MTNPTDVLVTFEDHSFPLRNCTWLCPMVGAGDYGEPLALVIPDSFRLIWIQRFEFFDENGVGIHRDDIDWEAPE